MKRICAFVLALALTAGLGAGALAREPAPLIAPNPTAYSTAITLNGEALDTSGIPAVSGALLPMRLLAEADHGSAYWSQEENESWFTFGEHRITVRYADNSVRIGDAVQEGVSATVKGGVTFLPAQIVNRLGEGYSAVVNQNGAGGVTVTTPNNDPMVKLAYRLAETAGMGYGMRASAADMEEYHGIHADNFTQVIGFFPMITSPDTLILGKAAGGKLDALKTELEAYRQAQEDTFTWYLAQHLPKVQNAQVSVSGDWVLFVIAENAAQAVEQFQAEAKGL